MDSGSNTNLLTNRIFNKLNLKGDLVHLRLNVAGNMQSSSKQHECMIQLQSVTGDFLTELLPVTTIQEIGAPFPPIPIDPKFHSHLFDLTFTEQYPIHQPRVFDFLLAEPYYSQLMLPDQRLSLDPSIPSAKASKLGWFLRGATRFDYHQQHTLSLSFQDSLTYEVAQIYNSNIEDFNFGIFWSSENVGIKPNESDEKDLTFDQHNAEQMQRSLTTFDTKTNRWKCALLWKDSNENARQLSSNFNRAFALLKKVHEKIKPEHHSLVSKAYNEIYENGWSELVPPEQQFRTDRPTYILTSRPVINLDRESTKCRIVINASQHDPTTKLTLNKLLLPGQNLLPTIHFCQLRSRIHEFSFSVGVSKMFFSIDLKSDADRDMLRYLWCDFHETTPKMYRYTVLPFGVISSPYQAMWCLRETAKKLQNRYPKAAKIIFEQLYMDDIFTGADSPESANQLLKDILTIMRSGGFHGHKIQANHPNILLNIPRAQVSHSETFSMLGLKINFQQNKIYFDLDSKFNEFDPNASFISRRMIISLASHIYDTLGFVSPFVMQYKQVLPMLWHNKTGWDENLVTKTIKDDKHARIPDPVAQKAVQIFKHWVNQIPLLKSLAFPRWIGGPILFMAIFTDASKLGMGVACYAVCSTSSGSLQSTLIMAKSSLMPKVLREKAILSDAFTIARAELVGCYMGITLGLFIAKTFEISSKQIVYFTDSLLNLQRIQRGKGHCKIWEERRITYILDNLLLSEYRFCPGTLNPADLPSRGCDLSELQAQQEFWFHGPKFLTQNKSSWPKQPMTEKIVNETSQLHNLSKRFDVDLDIKSFLLQSQAESQYNIEMHERHARIFTTQHKKNKNDKFRFIDLLMIRTNSWAKLTKIIVRIHRCQKKYRLWKASQIRLPFSTMMKTISYQETKEAELDIIRRAQEIHLSDEIAILQSTNNNNHKLPKNSILRNIETVGTATLVFYDMNLDFSNPLISQTHTKNHFWFLKEKLLKL
jgi:hypothetical protein